MKHLSLAIAIIMLALTLTTFTSCTRDNVTDDNNDTDTPYGYSTDGCIYLDSGNLICRIDTEERRMSVVCPDPVCEHSDDNCVARGKTQLTVCGDVLYFTGGSGIGHGWEQASDLYMYDLKEGSARIIFHIDGAVRHPRQIGHYVYFTAGEYVDERIENEDGSISVITSSLWDAYRYDIKTDKTEKLSSQHLDCDYADIDDYDAESKRIYWSMVNYPISTDLDFGDVRIEESPYGFAFGDWEYAIDFDLTNYSWKAERLNINTKEIELLFTGASVPVISPSADGMLYTLYEVDGNGNREKHGEVEDIVRFYSFAEETSKIVYEAPDELNLDGVNNPEMGNNECFEDWIVVGCHYYADEYFEYDDDENEFIAATEYYILVLNVETGENFIIKQL